MEVDSSFLDPIKEFHPILRVVEMPHEELAAMLPLRINLFSFVKHPYSESYGFPIDVPTVSGEELIRIHTMLVSRIDLYGADTATIQPRRRLVPNQRPMYNSLVPLGFSPEQQEYCLRASCGNDPVVVYEDRLVPLLVVEQHINALAIYCNTLHNDPANGHSPLLTRLPEGYSINSAGYLVGRSLSKKRKQPDIHGRWDFHEARDLLFTCIINYMRL